MMSLRKVVSSSNPDPLQKLNQVDNLYIQIAESSSRLDLRSLKHIDDFSGLSSEHRVLLLELLRGGYWKFRL